MLSVDEAAELFGIGRNKIRKISDSDDCPFVLWIGSHRKIKREAFEKFLNDIQSA
ncbi:MAG: helix-turn-helix domain-containing protein [Saccharofermentans sp.]|nr:helix-turn-helix domain-containing protein [Saccharofermentans sp.]